MIEINLKELEIKLQSILITANEAVVKTTKVQDLQQLKAQYLGKNAAINMLLKQILQIKSDNNAIIDQKLFFAKLINQTKTEIIAIIEKQTVNLQQQALLMQLEKEKKDVSLPEIKLNIGYRNPLFIISEQIINFFVGLGYHIIAVGNEVDNEEYNFNRLNLAEDHPARAMHDTFYIKSDETNNRLLLRTHCTNMTARILSQKTISDFQEPMGYLTLGNVYRKDDDDATHSHQFLQVDGFLVGTKVSFANLKWTLEKLCQELFGSDSKIRLRPSYFPFTEPSVEVDVSCPLCLTKGCSLCKKSGWIEILGAGIIHPHVFKLCDLENEAVSGFAFGIGIERIAMIKYSIDDIRLFYQNDYRFLKQF